MREAMQRMRVCLTPQQRKGLAARARSMGSTMAAEICSAVDAHLTDVHQEREWLNAATRVAERDICQMVAMIDATNARIAKRHAEMQRLRARPKA